MKKMLIAAMVVLAVIFSNCQTDTKSQTTHLVVSASQANSHTITTGKSVTIAEFSLQTNRGTVNLYNFITRWENAGVTYCGIYNAEGKRVDVTQSGHRPQGTDQLDLTFFFIPSSGVNPGKDYDYVTVGTQTTVFKVVCDIAKPVSDLKFTLREVVFQEREKLAGHLLQTTVDAR